MITENKIEKLNLETFNEFKPRKGLQAFISENGTVHFRLYDTIILSMNDKYIMFNSGGFRTNHTKNCINDNLPTGYSVFQKDFEWYINTPEGTIDFKDELVITK